MPAMEFQPLLEVFLLVEQPRQRLSHWTQALAPLDGPGAPPVATVDAYFDPTANQAIFRLRYDELALGPSRLNFVVEVALLAEIGMIQPAELLEGDRDRFVTERMAGCTVHVGDQRQIVRALVELVRRVRVQGQQAMASVPEPAPRAPSPPERAPSPPRAALARGSVRQPRHQVVFDDSPDAAAVPEPVQNHIKTKPITSPARRTAGAEAFEAFTSSESPEAFAPSEAAETVRRAPNVPARHMAAAESAESLELREWRESHESHDTVRRVPNVVPRGGALHRASTVTMEPEEAARMIEEATPQAEVEVITEPYLVAPGTELRPDTIYARYLRSGRWVPIRIGTLSLKGASLLAGALPRIDDRVDIALAYANYRALVRGAVGKVSTMQEAATTGAATFSVSFELDPESRRELTALLTAARAAKVTLKPPPLRSTRRYPVEWPILLGTTRGAVRAEALDVSTGGMFVKPVHALVLDTNVAFSMVLDDGLAPVSGRTRVVRNVSEGDAKITGLSPGYGLSIIEMPGEDRERWSAFITRIEQRASKRVLIGAAPARLAELQNGLVAAGYAVTGGTEPGAIAQLASTGAHPVDAALIDASWLAEASSSRVESLFSQRKLPCVTVHGDAQRARIAVDRLLSVV